MAIFPTSQNRERGWVGLEWPKLKNIILLMLACVNVFLMVLVVQRQWESRAFVHSAREDAVAVLWGTSRVYLDEALLPQELDLPALTVSRDQVLEQTQAAALLGEPLSLSADGLRYQGPRGTAQFYVDGEFSAELLPGACPLEGAAPEAYAVSLLAELGMEAEILAEEEQAAGETVVVVRQLWEGTPVFDCTAVLVFRGGEFREIRRDVSYRLVGVPQAAAQVNRLDLVTLLLRFADYINQNGLVCNEITGFTAGYTLDAQSEPNRLSPSWLVETDNGSYYWNTVTGTITPAG